MNNFLAVRRQADEAMARAEAAEEKLATIRTYVEASFIKRPALGFDIGWCHHLLTILNR